MIESIIGSTFTGRVAEEVRYGPYDAIVPVVEGQACLTGRQEFVIDPNDSLRDGFIIR